MAAGGSRPLYLDLAPVDGRRLEEELKDGGSKNERWMMDHMTSRLISESGAAVELAIGQDDGDAKVVAAAKRRGSATDDSAGGAPDPLPTDWPVDVVSPPMPEYTCAYCDGGCLPDRPAILIPVQLRKSGDGAFWQVDGVACRFPCAAAELFRRAGGEACGGTAIRRDEYMRGAEYLRLMFLVMTGDRWRDDWPHSPDPRRYLACYGMGGTKDVKALALEIASLDPYEAWNRRGVAESAPAVVREKGASASAVVSLGLALP